MVGIERYISADALQVPRLEQDFYYLRPEDFAAWRTYARELAVSSGAKRENAKRIAYLIDQFPDPELDLISGLTTLNELKSFVPEIKTLTEMADTGQLGGAIRIQALTSYEYSRAFRLSENSNSDWFIIAFGMNNPRYLNNPDDDEEVKAAAKSISNWNPTNIRLISRRINRITIHPGNQDKANESDAFRDFFEQDG